jgi:hypothetical protein
MAARKKPPSFTQSLCVAWDIEVNIPLSAGGRHLCLAVPVCIPASAAALKSMRARAAGVHLPLFHPERRPVFRLNA